MGEILKITDKYDAKFVRTGFSSLDGLNHFALGFYKDVAGIYDGLTRVKNVQRNPTSFSLGAVTGKQRFGLEYLAELGDRNLLYALA